MVFTDERWRLICLALVRSASIDSERKYYVKHDVECKPDHALRTAIIESELGISAVYFFQFDVFKNSVEIVRRIKELGHEIGYHYDVLDACRGDLLKADETFENHLRCFENHGFPIRYICPHGNPAIERSGWNSNKDFLRDQKIRLKYSSLVDYVVDFKRHFSKNTIYISDAGYCFRKIVDIENNDKVKTKDLKIDILKTIHETPQDIIISTHPHRWFLSAFNAYMCLMRFHILKAVYKKVSKIKLVRLVLHRYFYLARRM